MGSKEKVTVPEPVAVAPPHLVAEPVAGSAEFLAEAGDVFARLERLIGRGEALGIARQGFQGGGPHETELSRDVSAALFVAWRSLQAAIGFVQYGGDLLWDIRADMRGARNLLRGGRPDGAPQAERGMAVSMAHQAIGFALGIGFAGRTEDGAVVHLRQTYSHLFGSVFLVAPDDVTIRAHLNATSRAGIALAELQRGALPPMAFYREVDLASVALAADAVWAGHVAAGTPPRAESVFRFPMDTRDTSRPKLLARLQKAEGDKRRAAAKRAARRSDPL